MISPKSLMKIATTASVVAMTVSVAVVPAYAMQDITIEDSVAQSGSVTADNGVVMWSDDQSNDQTGDQQSQDSMPDNPNAKLPDTVSDEISDDATVVSEDLAVTPEGEVKNIETGEIVTDATLVGTQDQQPDPLAKTNGESFIPVSAEDVKDAVADANDANSAESQSDESDAIVKQSSAKVSAQSAQLQSTQAQSTQSNAKVQTAKFESNDYGAHWGTYNNSKAFFDYQNNLFVQQAKGVIDVSEWQGDIDWAKAKADGVEGVIIRLGYGEGNNADKKAQRNISECKRLGIPFGIYWYSYADTPSLAKEEGADVVAKLKQFGVNPSDLAYPVYYDLEKWTWEATSRRPIRTCTTISSTTGTARCSPPDTRIWRLLVHQLPARTAEACRYLRQNHVGGAVWRSHGIRFVPDQQSRMAIHQLRQGGRHQRQCGYECVRE